MKKLCVLLMVINFPFIGKGQENVLINHQNLIEDARQMLNLLEEIHPQPYYNGGGKIAFHQRFQNLLQSIPADGMTREDFRGLLSPFVATVGDGHTHVYPDVPTDFTGIPLLFYVVEKYLYVAGILDKRYVNLLGSKLISVEGVTIEEIVLRASKYYGSDNIYGTLVQLANFELFLAKETVLEDLVPEWINHESIAVTLQLPEGQIKKVTFQSPPPPDWELTRPEPGIKLPDLNGLEFGWGFLQEDPSVAYLRVQSMVENRETYEKRVSYSDVTEEANSFYESVYGKAAHGSIDEVIAKLPSLTSTYTDLVQQMKIAGTQALIVDLQTNVGGWALPADILVYFLYGKEALINLHRRTNIAIRKLSSHYFNSDPDQSLEELNIAARNSNLRNFTLVENDYDFSDHTRMTSGLLDRAYAEQIVEDDLKLSKTFYTEYKEGGYSKYYCPDNVVVLVNAATFSAGFMFAKYLELMGARVVGTTPSQNIVQMGETIHFELNHSRLSGNISRSQLTLDTEYSGHNSENLMMTPDNVLTYEKLKEFKFSRHAAILYALELIGEM